MPGMPRRRRTTHDEPAMLPPRRLTDRPSDRPTEPRRAVHKRTTKQNKRDLLLLPRRRTNAHRECRRGKWHFKDSLAMPPVLARLLLLRARESSPTAAAAATGPEETHGEESKRLHGKRRR